MKKLLVLLLIILGLVFILSCEKSSKPKDNDPPSQEVILGEKTKILRNQEEIISSFNQDGTITFTNSTPQIDSLETGDILISGVTAAAPNGFLRKIESIDDLSIQTSEATLEDAFQELHIDFSKTLKPEDLSRAPVCGPGVFYDSEKSVEDNFYFNIDHKIYENDSDEVNVTGTIEFSPSIDFDVDLTLFGIKKVKFLNTTEVKTSLNISCTAEFYGIDETYEIAQMYFHPITVGYIVIVPLLTLDVNGKATVEMQISAGVTQNTTFEAGFEYNNGNWENLSDLDTSFPAFTAPEIVGNASLQASAGPQMNFLLYGVAGPYIETNLYGKDTISLFADPWWKIEGGIEVGGGVQFRVLSSQIADYYFPAVIGYNVVIAQADNVLQGTLKGIVYDAVSQTPLAGVDIMVKEDSEMISQANNDASGQYEVELPVAQNYTVIFSKSGYQSLSYNNVSIEGLNDTHLEPVMQIDDAHLGQGNISGSIYNALTNTPEAEVSIFLRDGMNQMDSEILHQTITDSYGNYMLENVESGNYTIEASKTDFSNSYFNVYCLGNETVSDQNGVITPELLSNEIRIVLTWGATPSDLDSHITGPNANNDDRFHVYYANRSYSYDNETYVDLDIDDTSSYGPETITIYNQTNGLYRYTIHDYSNRNNVNSLYLSNSNAQVRVYMGSQLLRSFNVPANIPGTAWTVFEMHGTVINAINEITGAPNYKGDVNFDNLPIK